ncbi:type I-E CRISPR-associated protein Cas7/Cse4/CasC [Oryzibacter oryziterrae]|uniref:type I-E CRISPR-associated protein Cas7/Cse4/CasC n=1 Tax=Oryzibacter oryziterrae TaxID=2766474 RepID=UPI001F0263F8|nr:type I-E CRISPR-associated protein Cas7/Cse4/CasC [Oryzibacter oryziterrae]
MTIFIQLHLLTFVPPSNLNRDDTGTPKTANVGGDTRLRLSSQSLKRAWRTSEVFESRLKDHLGSRTQRFGDHIREKLIGKGVPSDIALKATRKVIEVFGKPEDSKVEAKETYTKQLAFISEAEKTAALELAEKIAAGADVDDKKLAAMVLKRADTAADIAMFGRMFADNPDFNREAAVQVAHAITTHRVAVEDDYYTAVDDLNEGRENVGAGFVGEAGFGSGVFYLYLCVDTGALVRNLGGDEELAKSAIAALVEAAATVAPNGKQASFASRVRSHFILAERGSDQPRTLASAFAKAVEPKVAMETSHKRLLAMRDKFAKAYADSDTASCVMDLQEGEGALADIIAFATDWKA